MIALIPLALLGIAGWFDLRTREIPDVLPLALLACAVAAHALDWDQVTWGDAALGAALGLALPAVLFYAGGMGGGDVKLLASLGALVGWPAVLELLLGTAVAGGLLAVIVLALPGRHGVAASLDGAASADAPAATDDAASPDADPLDHGLPYALAIAAGFGFVWARGSWPTGTGVLA